MAKQATTGQSLTRQERNMLRMAATGLINREIASREGVSKRTVDFHLYNTYEKLGVSNRIQAINIARSRGLLEISAAA
ncbi:hypothetical protein CCAX7_55150 [Capsulimonas corticalis]|uniref:Uncharacterized protein n=1 Tax=Capsulimonas corticalis TaxID=2219043 RepID=A0A402D5K6_9BACT|nr:helix-turn-helix transcriptional regulator [Capsulimonas corticalis]BDI33464.1 hypothetical protein CCAX7_55150 [Capsulimonas corticalis]